MKWTCPLCGKIWDDFKYTNTGKGIDWVADMKYPVCKTCYLRLKKCEVSWYGTKISK